MTASPPRDGTGLRRACCFGRRQRSLIGTWAEFASYLSNVEHSELTQVRFNPFQVAYRTVPGSAAPAGPGLQDFWVVSARGPGTQQIELDLTSGDWAMVIMNADGTQPVAVDVQAGVRSNLLAPV